MNNKRIERIGKLKGNRKMTDKRIYKLKKEE
jgi:hypothetical protein